MKFNELIKIKGKFCNPNTKQIFSGIIFDDYKIGLKNPTFLGDILIEKNAFTYYIENGLFHNLYGPAVTKYNYKHWYKNGKLHREDGPAKIHECRNKIKKSYYYNGKRLNINSDEELKNVIINNGILTIKFF